MIRINAILRPCFPGRSARLWAWAFVLLAGLIPDRIRAQAALPAARFPHAVIRFGGLERADTTLKTLYLAFTGGDYQDGGKWIRRVLRKTGIKAHFFFTGDFFRAAENRALIKSLIRQGHYLGPHSDKHLLYAAWENRDSLLVSEAQFKTDLLDNYAAMAAFGIRRESATLFMPPYEWYNLQISEWAAEMGITLVNYTPGTRSNADYTTPDMGAAYISSAEIYARILQYESQSAKGLNGFILLIHIGTHPDRQDKFYYKLSPLIQALQARGYRFGLL